MERMVDNFTERSTMKMKEVLRMSRELNERCERAVKEMDKWWIDTLEGYLDECTTDEGTTDFDQFAVMVMDLLVKRKINEKKGKG